MKFGLASLSHALLVGRLRENDISRVVLSNGLRENDT